ncbi:hypothetical protein JFQ93_001457 [Aeromonas sobria]|nr:hypothetical protein [Aeromonas sobria]
MQYQRNSQQNDKQDQQQAHIDALLQEAIKHWRPEQPRRWLAKYGGWPFEGKSPLVVTYWALRRQAQALTRTRKR